MTPRWYISEVALDDVRPMFEEQHKYRSAGRIAVYCFAVFEYGQPVAAFVWQPPAPGAAKSVCPDLPQGVLALSRMVALPKKLRTLNHISKPLRWQMNRLIDRTRWPVLVTYSDESVGHTGHVYKCSGWRKTTRMMTTTVTVDGKRVSTYSCGRSKKHDLGTYGKAWIQRWEHWATDNPVGLFNSRWIRKEIVGKVWRSGNQAFTFVEKGQECA